MSNRPTRKPPEQARLDRRGQVDNLLARYARHVPVESARLRDLLAEEFAEGDRYRREAGGQQAAVRREQQQRAAAAAEQAIVEAEQRAEQAEESLRSAYQCNNDGERHRAKVEQRAEQAEAALAKVREQLAALDRDAVRYMVWLAETRHEAGAPNWPALASTVKALRGRAEGAEQQLAEHLDQGAQQ